MVYALVMWISIASLGQYKPIVVQGFLSAPACNTAAAAIMAELKASKLTGTETHTCVPNFTAP